MLMLQYGALFCPHRSMQLPHRLERYICFLKECCLVMLFKELSMPFWPKMPFCAQEYDCKGERECKSCYEYDPKGTFDSG